MQIKYIYYPIVVVVQLLHHVQLFATPWTAACQASVSFIISWSLLRLMMSSNHFILYYPLLLLPSIFPSIRVFSNESALHIGWPNIGASASASVLPMNIQGWFRLGLAGLLSLQSKGLSRVFSSTQFKSINSLALSLLYGPTLTPVHDYWKNHGLGYIMLYMCVYIYIIHKMRYLRTGLWRLISKICSQQERNTGKSMCNFSPSPKVWKPEVIIIQVPIWKPADSRPKKSQCFHLNPKAKKYNDPAQSGWRSSSSSTFSFCSSLHLIGWAPSTLRRKICFTQSADSNINLTQKHPHRLIQNDVWLNVWAPCDPVQPH